MKITVGQITDRGLNPRRTHNEDNLLALPERGLFLVADGVGGRLGGEVASGTVIDIFTRVFSQPRDDRDLRDVLADAIELCNQKVFDDARANEELDGMATTLALVAVEGERAVVAHVGDSRVYRYDEQGLITLTEDHSEVNEQLRAGMITAEQALRHPRRNVISRAIGAEPEVEADFREIEIDEFTSFILCTDGITLHVTDDELARLMKSGQPPQALCERLKDLCYQGGAEDNLTAIVVDFGDRSALSAGRAETAEPAARDWDDAPTRVRRPANANGSAANRIEFSLKPETEVSPEPEVSLPEVRLEAAAPPKQTAQLKATPGQQQWLEQRATPAGQPPSVDRSTAAPSRRSITLNLPELQIPKPSALEEGELPIAMKITLLAIALVIGIVAGWLLRPYLNRGELLPANSSTGKSATPLSDPEVNAAYARFLEGKPDEARAQLNTAIAADPNNAEAHYYLGVIDYAQARYDEAINHLAQAAKIDPNLADVRIRLAMAYISIGQPRNAKDVLQQVVTPPKAGVAGDAPTTASPAASATPAG